MISENDRLKKIRLHLKMKQEEFANVLGMQQGSISDIERGRNTVSDDVKYRLDKEINVNKNWIETGEGDMFKTPDPNTEPTSEVVFYDPENAPAGKRLIPLYDDVSTIGGKLKKGYSAKMQPDAQAAEWIDPGDWFKSATAAIRHHEDSMVEYPPGCILALKEVFDRKLIVPGKDYVIETQEYRITKKVQFAEDQEYIRVHSTNIERYEDGTLIHQPFNIHINSQIVRIFEVLGYVVKKGGGTIVYSNNSK